MVFRSLLARRRAHQQESTQQELLGEFRSAVDAARFGDAFACAEQLLDLAPPTEVYEELLRPVDRLTVRQDSARLYDMLRELEHAGDSDHAPWRLLLRFALLEQLEWHEEAYKLSASFREQPARYAWMRYNRAWLLMNRMRAYDEAGEDLAAALRTTPKFWKALGTLAECDLCLGHENAAFAHMDACVTRLSEEGRRRDVEAARVWRGELHLWIGHYPEAIADLAPGVTQEIPYALIWSGAAHLLQGDPERALELLDRAVELTPHDGEAHVWRGEAYEKLGEWDRALANFDRAAGQSGVLWPEVGRALAHAGRGNSDAALEAFRSVPRKFRDFFQWQANVRGADDNAAAAAEVLHEMRRAARGLRRGECYLEVLWTRRSVPTG